MSNRLAHESSPYLLQHAHNPVAWYPWGTEAIERARAEEKPIRPEYVQEVAQAYSEFFFNYNEGPLLIVNGSDIDFVGNAEHRRELIDVIHKAPPGTSHWSRG